MMNDLVGVRFAPTGEELLIHYLKNKILGNARLVDKAINEIKILSYEPMFLPSLSKIQSDDLEWYFFSSIEYENMKKKTIKRTIATGNGVWKSSGQDRTINGKRRSKGEIGIKKSFVYYERKGSKKVRTPWIMHEYHITCLSDLSPELMNYVICKVKYNGEDGDISFGDHYNQSGQSQSLVSSDRSFNMRAINTGPEKGQEDYLMNEQEDDVSMWDIVANTLNSDNNNRRVHSEVPHHLTPNDAEFIAGLTNVDPRPVEYLFSMKHDFNVHMPKKPLSGIIDYSSDSNDDDDDAESTSELSYQGSSSPDSVRNSNRHFIQTGGDEIQLANTSTDKTKTQVKQDRSRAVDTSIDKKTFIVKTEKKSRVIAEEAMKTNNKNPRYIHLINTMISFILLLGFFGNIISALL